MITFLIGVVVLWIVWRCLTRSSYVEIAPPQPSMPVTILTPSIVIYVHIDAQ